MWLPSRRGWRTRPLGDIFLDGRGRWFATFTKGKPKAVRYRMEPAGRKEDIPDLEQREVYRSLGWDYVCTVGGTFYVWRCDDPDAPELDSFWWRDTGAYPAQVLGER